MNSRSLPIPRHVCIPWVIGRTLPRYMASALVFAQRQTLAKLFTHKINAIPSPRGRAAGWLLWNHSRKITDISRKISRVVCTDLSKGRTSLEWWGWNPYPMKILKVFTHHNSRQNVHCAYFTLALANKNVDYTVEQWRMWWIPWPISPATMHVFIFVNNLRQIQKKHKEDLLWPYCGNAYRLLLILSHETRYQNQWYTSVTNMVNFLWTPIIKNI